MWNDAQSFSPDSPPLIDPPPESESPPAARPAGGTGSEISLRTGSDRGESTTTATDCKAQPPQGEFRFPVFRFPAQRKWVQRNPLKRWCHLATASALKRGVIARQPCQVCGEPAEAHHADHRRPLDVMWLCREHHKAHHALENKRGAE